MVLGKFPVPGRPTNLDHSRARACCACSGCGWGWETARYRLKYCLKGSSSPKQPTNQHATSKITKRTKTEEPPLDGLRWNYWRAWISLRSPTLLAIGSVLVHQTKQLQKIKKKRIKHKSVCVYSSEHLCTLIHIT